MPTSDSWTRRRTLLFMALLFIIALLPRLAAIDRYITPDELTWVYRSVLLREAIRQGQWAETLTAGHPGVTTTWLGATAMSAQLIIQPAAREAYQWATHLAWLAPDNAAAFAQLATFLSGGRILVAVVNSLGLVALFPLLSRLYNQPVAVLATLLLALDPFYAGLSGLLHVDGLMTTFALLSLVSLALIGRDGGRWMAVLSGAMAGLALLSKTPALLLLPLTGLYLLARVWWPAGSMDIQVPPWTVRLRQAVQQGGVWVLSFLVTLLLLLPAIWAAPLSVLSFTSGSAGRHIEEALRPTFFLGEIAFEHGPLFYPVNLAFRLSPVVFAGLLVAALVLLVHLVRDRRLPSLPTLLLTAWIVLFLVGISLAAKKFDRYALPVIPPLVILAALGWWQLRLLLMRGVTGRQPSFNGGTILLLLLQGLYLLRFTPYPLAAYNILLGGPAVAEEVVSVGWGEGVSAGGQWLNNRPDAQNMRATADSLPALAPFFAGESIFMTEDNIPTAEVVILSLNSRQIDPAGFARIADNYERWHTVAYAGREQAWVFGNPQPQPRLEPVPFTAPLAFGEEVQLWAATPVAGDQRLHLDVLWGLSRPVAEDYSVLLTVQDPAGNTWSRLETPLLNEVYFPPVYWAAEERPQLRYTLDLPPAAPPGAYAAKIALFNAATGEQLPLRDAQGTFQGVTYATEPVQLSPLVVPVSPIAVDIPVPNEAVWLGGQLILLGSEELVTRVTAGDTLPLDLFWHAPAGALPPSVTVTFQMGDGSPVEWPLSAQFPARQWRAGETVQEKYQIPVPPTLPAGNYSLTITVCAPGVADCTPQALGQVEVVATDRNFTLPDRMDLPLGVSFQGLEGEEMVLVGADIPAEPVAPGERVEIVLHWQVADRPVADYTVFVHLLDDAGRIVAQGDQWPGGLPLTLRAAGEVIRDAHQIELPVEAPLGEYAVIVGLYTAEDGVRRPVVDAQGNPLSTDYTLLPVTILLTGPD